MERGRLHNGECGGVRVGFGTRHCQVNHTNRLSPMTIILALLPLLAGCPMRQGGGESHRGCAKLRMRSDNLSSHRGSQRVGQGHSIALNHKVQVALKRSAKQQVAHHSAHKPERSSLLLCAQGRLH